jgi:hypothetical protein
MSNTITNSINFSQPYVGYSPLTAGVSNEPAITTANMIINTIFSPPNVWSFNRNENSSTSTVAGTQDYAINISDLNFIERVSLTDTNGKIHEVPTVYNHSALSVQATQGRPLSVSVRTNNLAGTNAIRFSLVPDAVYVINITYQKLPVAVTTLSGTWSGIPDSYSDIYNNLYLAEAFAQTLDDVNAQKYRVRGMAALVAKVEGLTETQKNLYMMSAMGGNIQQMAAQLRVQQGTQARAQ